MQAEETDSQKPTAAARVATSATSVALRVAGYVAAFAHTVGTFWRVQPHPPVLHGRAYSSDEDGDGPPSQFAVGTRVFVAPNDGSDERTGKIVGEDDGEWVVRMDDGITYTRYPPAKLRRMDPPPVPAHSVTGSLSPPAQPPSAMPPPTFPPPVQPSPAQPSPLAMLPLDSLPLQPPQRAVSPFAVLPAASPPAVGLLAALSGTPPSQQPAAPPMAMERALESVRGAVADRGRRAASQGVPLAVRSEPMPELCAAFVQDSNGEEDVAMVPRICG